MTAVTQGQTTYNQFPAFALPGQLADLAGAEIQSFPAYAVIQPGRLLTMASDALSVQHAQQTSADVSFGGSVTAGAVGISLLQTARESAGAYGITGYGVGGPQYNIGDTVPVLQRGRVWGEWKGTTQVVMATPNVYCSTGTAIADQGKFTDAVAAATTGHEVAACGSGVRIRQTSPGTGNIVLLDINLPGAA
jgi:hypothetical protein